LQELISPPKPSEVDTPVWLVASLSAECRNRSWEGKSIEGTLKVIRRPESRWATTAGVLLVPECELTERSRRVKQRWQDLIVEARNITDA
jgi:hypothetical protein